MKTILTFLASFLFPFVALAQEKGLDEKVNDAFMPFASWWEGFVLTSIPVGEYNIPIVLILLIFGATFFTIYFKFPSISQFPLAINTVRGKYDELDHHGVEQTDLNVADGDLPGTIKDESQEGEVSHFQALATALSGTVGLGNIAGVAVAVSLGGPGATFWMILAGFLGMSSKFTECTLGVKYRNELPDGTVSGGPMYYLTKGLAEKGVGFAKFGKVLAVLFAIFCVGGSFGGGNMFQANQSFAQLVNVTGGDASWLADKGWLFGLVIAALVGLVIMGGIKGIARVTSKIVPFMAVTYVTAGLVIIFANLSS